MTKKVPRVKCPDCGMPKLPNQKCPYCGGTGNITFK